MMTETATPRRPHLPDHITATPMAADGHSQSLGRLVWPMILCHSCCRCYAHDYCTSTVTEFIDPAGQHHELKSDTS